MADARQFKLDIERWITNEVPAKAAETQRRMVGEALTVIVQSTPVGNNERWASNIRRKEAYDRSDKKNKKPFEYLPRGYVGGQARRNWQVTLGTPSRQVLPGTDKDGQQALSGGYGVIARITQPSLVWIANPLPYMDALENGWSKQAPSGMVAQAVRLITAKYARVQ